MGDIALADDLFDIDQLFADDPELMAMMGGKNAAPGAPASAVPAPSPASFTPSPAFAMPDLGEDLPSLDDLFADLEIPQLSDIPSVQAAPQVQAATAAGAIPGYIRVPDAPLFPEQHLPAEESPVPSEAALGEEHAKPKTKGRKIGRIVFDVLFYVIILLIVGGAVLFASSSDPTKSLFGFRPYVAKTASMTPTPQADGTILRGGFHVGDLVIVRITAPENIKVGDVITFNPDSSNPSVYLTHRVTQVLNNLNGDPGVYFVTKGDANPSEDPPISGAMMVGKSVMIIPFAGTLLQFLRDNFVLALIVVISAFGFVILLRMYLADPRKKKKPAPAAARLQ